MSKDVLVGIYVYLFIFVVIFLITFIMDLLKIKKRKFKKIGEVQYLVNKFKIDTNKISYKKTCLVISLINAFIISTVTIIIFVVDVHMTLQLLLGFVLLFSLIYIMYEIYGRILIKKGYQQKKENKESKDIKKLNQRKEAKNNV